MTQHDGVSEIRIISIDGPLSAQFRPGWNFFLHRYLGEPNFIDLDQQCRRIALGVPAGATGTSFSIDAIVILPDHLHAIFTLPEGDADFSGRWRRIKSAFTRQATAEAAIERNAKGEYAPWQRRFWEHTVRDVADFTKHVDYIHYNPVKHGLVDRVCDWPYSSFHRFVRQGLLPLDWGGNVKIGAANFGEPSD